MKTDLTPLDELKDAMRLIKVGSDIALDEAIGCIERVVSEHQAEQASVSPALGSERPADESIGQCSGVASEISDNGYWDKIEEVLEEASRIIDYFANGKTLFVGSGTPIGCLERLNHAMNLVEHMRKPKPVSVSLEKCKEAIADKMSSPDEESCEIFAKAVLDSAKEQGARIEYVED